ncbi:MAG: ABC-2 type [Desulfobulbaceae bacterium]|jgi:ABC-type multidrug transport system permease subunit|nr:MAG: ABC-2 type [Desulfobulbaceae bacterium]
MTRGWTAVYLRELLILKRRLPKLLPTWSVSPLLYLIAFGYAVGRHVDVGSHSYLEFLLPGLVAMASMTQAYAVASEINIARFYWHIFDEFQAAPISNLAYVMGEVLAGMTRAFLASLVILLLGACFGVVLFYGPMFWIALLLNSFVFASLAVGCAMHVKSHADQTLLTNFIITPMAFLGGTFFPLSHLPGWGQTLLELLPLTHASHAVRAAAFQEPAQVIDFLVLIGAGGLCFLFAILSVNRAKV